MLRERGSAVLNNPEATAGLKLELAIADSIGRPLCQSTYMLEGGGPLMLIAYDIRDFLFSLFADRMEQFCGVHFTRVGLLEQRDGEVRAFLENVSCCCTY